MSNRIKEEDIVVPALKIVRDNPGCSTEDIIKTLSEIMVLSPEDQEILAGRSDTKFSQIVRNLISHYDTNKFGKYTDRTKIGRNYQFTLNSNGLKFLDEFEFENIQELIEDEQNNDKILDEEEYSLADLQKANNRDPEPGTGSASKRYKTDPKIAKTVLVNCNYLCEYGILTNNVHKTFDAKRGNLYLEAHHLIPMKAQKDFLPKNLDRVENIVGLCPMCHAIVHHGTLAEKKKVLQVLYDDRIKKLNSCEQSIDIDFNELIIKYYL